MARTVLIIGGGVAGLSAGCYAQMNGYESQVLEMHTIPGGLCTSWRRGGYTMDGCLQYLTGSGAQTNAHRMWQELGAVQGRAFFNRSEWLRIESSDGRALVFYTNVDQLEAHLLDLSPRDAAPIRSLCKGIRDLAPLDLPLDKARTPLENLEFGKTMMPYLPAVLRWNRHTLRSFARKFKDPFLREAFPQFFQFAFATFPMTILLMTLGMMHNQSAGYPMGGSLRFALAIANRYKALGGTLHCRTRVKRILVENDRTCGVVLTDGSELRADVVISAADGYDTLFTMLDGKYLNETVRGYYHNLPVAEPIVQVSLGINLPMTEIPHNLSVPMSRPHMLAGKMQDRIVARHYAFDPQMAPPGKTPLTVWLEADYDYWKRLSVNRLLYDDVQDDVAEVVVEELNGRFPGLKAAVEVVDVATPATYERFTENWRGAIAGWSITKAKMKMMMGKGMSKTLPGLANFYMIGQWVEPAGNVELSAVSGRDVVKMLCAVDRRPFFATLPRELPPADAPLPAETAAEGPPLELVR